MEALLAAGADIHAKNAGGDTPLHSATRHSWRQSALGQQAPRVDTAVVRILIQAGADVHARNVGGGTPLHAAWSEGNVLVADRLVAMGADPDALDAAGRPAGDPACDWQEWGGLDRSPVESVRGCLEKGTDPNARDEYGGTPLHRLVGPWPANASPLPAILALLTAGADVNARSLRGTTPLHSAAGATDGRIEIAAALIEAGADIHAVDDEGVTPLHAAAASGAPAYISWLVDNGADVAARDARGRTPLHAAAQADNPGAADALLARERIPAHSTLRGRPQIRRHASTGTPRRSPWRPMRTWSRRASTWEPT